MIHGRVEFVAKFEMNEGGAGEKVVDASVEVIPKGDVRER